ncbi:MAG: hypothetical protein ACKVWR_00775 [Acidimicrobiales bacterium]
MNAPARLALFVAAVAGLGAAAFGAARALDGPSGEADRSATTAAGTGPGCAAYRDAPPAAALTFRQGPVRLEPLTGPVPAGAAAPYRFRLEGLPSSLETTPGEPPLHLIVIRRDLAHFQHLHPEPAADGAWATPLTLPEPGVYRVITDFAVCGRRAALGVDLAAPGPFSPAPPPPSPIRAPAGYEAALTVDGSALRFRLAYEGQPVTDLEPYLGHQAHLVALREADLAYVHAHPKEQDGNEASGPGVELDVAFPTADPYRLFLEVSHRGRVPVFEVRLEAQPAGAAPPSPGHGGDSGDSGDDHG